MNLIFKHNIGTYGFGKRKAALAPKPSLEPGGDITPTVLAPKHIPLTDEFCAEFMASVSDAKTTKANAKRKTIAFLRSFTNIDQLATSLGKKFAEEVRPFKVFMDRRTVRTFGLVERYSMATLFRGGYGSWVNKYWTKVVDGACLVAADRAAFPKSPFRSNVYPMLVGDMEEWEREMVQNGK